MGQVEPCYWLKGNMVRCGVRVYRKTEVLRPCLSMAAEEVDLNKEKKTRQKTRRKYALTITRLNAEMKTGPGTSRGTGFRSETEIHASFLTNIPHLWSVEKETGKVEPLAKCSKSSKSTRVTSRLAISSWVTHVCRGGGGRGHTVLAMRGKKTEQRGKKMKCRETKRSFSKTSGGEISTIINRDG